MALYQKSVLKRYLKGLDQQLVQQKYEAFKTYFLNLTIQENIRKSKEEQFQATFLNELFVKILGYTLNPQPNYNLATEYKNVRGAKKADGAILQDGKAIAVIELKGTNTTDLNKVESQAFGYKSNQPHAVYVITSNFEKLRFYIDNAVDYEEFNLFHLSFERFKILWLCLAKDSIFKGLPKKIKDNSLVAEETITKKLYKDYSTFKHLLFESILQLNPQFDQLLLYKKTQKLLDRFLFIFFAEDGGLLPPNSIQSIINQWIQLRDELDAYTPLYNRFKKYFGYMNEGHKGKKHDIFAYNGGLFASDEILDTIKIDDTLLYIHTQKLSAYDFKSEVDVNILGHIFEHSLNEIEAITAQIAGKAIDKRKSKRKKDGVFYTPKYITKYIVENTIETLCEAKKKELAIDETDYHKGRKRRKKAIIKTLKTKLDTYRNWLLGLTICDPACGSGAFLNQALDFLIKEHQYIDELQTKLLGGGFVFPNIENAILENNLYGVDINEESVDIAKLSLWLRSAQPNRKLTTLNNNIKCGNSLIDDPKIAGDKAFNWKKEFPTVFEKGGFDVVIGNPPYGAKLPKHVQKYLNSFYIKGASETVIAFMKLSYDLIKDKRYLSFIIPKSFCFSSNYKSIRDFVLDNIIEIVDCGKVWRKVKLEQIIFNVLKNQHTKKYISSIRYDKEIVKIGKIDKETFNTFGFYLNGISNQVLKIGRKIHNIGIFLNDISINSRGGMFQKYISTKGNINVIGGAEIKRYRILGIKGKIDVDLVKNDSRAFIKDNSILVQNIVAHIENPTDHIKITACLPFNKAMVIVDTINQITVSEDYDAKFIWLILNSKLMNWYCYRFIFGKAIRTMHFDNAVTKRIPIPKLSPETQRQFAQKANILSNAYNLLYKKADRFLSRIQSNLSIEKPSKKLKTFYQYDFKTFVSELKKKKVKLSLVQQDEWEEYFEAYKTEINELQVEINKIDKEIDSMVYELYGLTKEEIQVVEAAT